MSTQKIFIKAFVQYSFTATKYTLKDGVRGSPRFGGI